MTTNTTGAGSGAAPPGNSAVLDEAHLGDIQGAMGTIRQGDLGIRTGLSARMKTLLAIVGPGLIVMVGDNDAGAFGTYTQAGQNYGTSLLWTLLLLVPVLYVNQEMVLRLGAVTGVGHARLILERFGRFWGAFSVIDLFLLNALTIVTEFIGISLGLSYRCHAGGSGVSCVVADAPARAADPTDAEHRPSTGAQRAARLSGHRRGHGHRPRRPTRPRRQLNPPLEPPSPTRDGATAPG
ncbi:MAG: divalent metal cation transporter [Pseudonocardiaceae bacterium]